MDFNAIAEFVKTYLIDHWPFVLASLLLGTIGQFFKTKVWTCERATRIGWKGHFFWWMQATLSLHAPLAGALLGLSIWMTRGDGEAFVGPGVAQTKIAVMTYYMGAGLLSAWLFAGWRHFLQARGIPVPSEFQEVKREHIYLEKPEDGAVEATSEPKNDVE